MMAADWSPHSWASKVVMQAPDYKHPEQVDAVLSQLKNLPPLVHPKEIDALKQQLAEASEGNRFLLQGGDCAEIFNYCNQRDIENKLKVLIQMSLVLIYGARLPLVRILRGAGQYAKPRSKPTEVINGIECPSYRGDNINGYDVNDREHDPNRLLSAYFHSAATLNYIRALLAGGFGDLHKPNQWNLEFMKADGLRKEYDDLKDRVQDAIDFMKTIHAEDRSATGSLEIFSSHEGLILPYEEALTRKCENGKYYNVGAHFLWIGDRTRQIDGGHVEYFRGIQNPIGVKIGPSMKSDELVRLLQILNPDNEPGKITLITRYGVGLVQKHLYDHIRAVRDAGLKVVWCCDPMHGNTETTSNGTKTRHFNKILEELSLNLRVHKEMGSRLHGVHFELTGDDVTECLDGFLDIDEQALSRKYQTQCDPRLNYEQSLHIAFQIAKYYKTQRLNIPSL